MTADEFNEKYEQWLPQGWYGLDIDIPVVTEFLDAIFQDFTKIPGFEYHQIKLKFGMCRFYTTLGHQLESVIEAKINSLIKEYEATR